ncbi:HD domain-containing protein [Halobacillus litoralis]|uniref:Phosphohydrolase n=1 Tax=Halobacillus litoralis TaxID=45668 RepID=A0A410MCW8_9BACI|nr:HD domain-containing protein [Halobacillus litoralis]QAS52594.1 phosphohydrolase [Halobacillus litoralis]
MMEKAKAFAEEAHRGQKRKSSNEDYIVHPIRVAEILKEAGYRDAVICAGYLHDVAEDTEYSLDDIEKEFGVTVKNLVASHTEDKSKSWQERKQHTIDTVASGSEEIKALIIADKLDNLRSLKKEMDIHGEVVWNFFNAGYDSQKWYNESIAKAIETGHSKNGAPLFFFDYRKLVKQTFD